MGEITAWRPRQILPNSAIVVLLGSALLPSWIYIWSFPNVKLCNLTLNGKSCFYYFRFPFFDRIFPPTKFVCVEVLWPSQPNGVMSSAVSLPN